MIQNTEEVGSSMSKFIPHAYQSYAIQKIIENPACGLFLDMGLRQNGHHFDRN